MQRLSVTNLLFPQSVLSVHMSIGNTCSMDRFIYSLVFKKNIYQQNFNQNQGLYAVNRSFMSKDKEMYFKYFVFYFYVWYFVNYPNLFIYYIFPEKNLRIIENFGYFLNVGLVFFCGWVFHHASSKSQLKAN